MDTSTSRIVTLSGCDVTLQFPGLTVCREIIRAMLANETRAALAALGVWWPAGTPRPGQLVRPAVSYLDHKCDPLSFGGAFSDGLESAGVDYQEILAAATQALLLTAEQLPRPDDEQAAAGN